MERERWDRLGDLFDQVLKRQGRERDEFLSALPDAGLRDELRSLLDAHHTRGRFDEMSDHMNGRDGARSRFEPGDSIGPYRVEREIGVGGSATVYLAHDTKHGRNVAIKVLRPELAATLGVERFLQEIDIASKLTHPHILPVFDSGESDRGLWFAMPFVEGESLRDRLEREGSLSVEATIRVADQVCSALAWAHERGIVHRDIKPGNILLAGDRAVVADFGIARAIAEAGEDRLTQTGLSIGTPAYMSPEQISGMYEVDARSDVYSVGCVVYEMVSGRPPFDDRASIAARANRVSTPPPRLRATNPGIPVYVERAVVRALATHPEDRFRTTTEFAEALTTGTVVARFSRRQRRRWLGRAAVAAALIAGGAIMPSVLGGSAVDRLAVLPLANHTNEEAYLVEGVHEALISELAQLGIPVIARASTVSAAAEPRSIREIASPLDVGMVIEGGLFRRGDSLQVTARLYDGRSESVIWNGSFDGSLPDVVAMYRAFARAIAREVDVQLTEGDETRLQRTSPVNPDVYAAYLRGMHLLNQSTEESFEQALDHFQQAVSMDPADARAYAGLAFAYITLAHGPAPPPDALNMARAAAERAVRLDSTLAEGWAALADIRTYLLWDWAGAEEAFLRAADLNPSLAMNWYHYAWYLGLFDRRDESLAAHVRARDLDPLTPLHTVWLPGIYILSDQYERALDGAREALAAFPDNAVALYVLGLAAAGVGDFDEAIAAHEKAASINPRWKFAVGRSYALAGRTAEARAILAQLEAEPPSAWGAYTLAAMHTALGNFDEAFRWLAHEPAHAWLPWTGVMPEFEPLLDDPRFQDLRRRLDFVQ